MPQQRREEGHDVIPSLYPMSILDVAPLSLILAVAHISKTVFIVTWAPCKSLLAAPSRSNLVLLTRYLCSTRGNNESWASHLGIPLWS